MKHISIIGTGDMAAAIGALAANAGYGVEVMGRNAGKAAQLADRLGPKATTGPFGSRPKGELVVLAVPYPAVAEVSHTYGEELAGKILVDITNPIATDLSRFLVPDGTSGAREIARKAPPSASIIKAFNTQNARVLDGALVRDGRLDGFVAGDNEAAKSAVMTFIGNIGLRPMDVGPLDMAWTLERGCMLWLGLMKNSVGHMNFAIGLDVFD